MSQRLQDMPAPQERLPAVSVVVPVHGDRGGLAVTLDALRRQDYLGEVQVLVADNGDNPGLGAAAGDGVEVVPAPVPGSYAARNAALRRARGQVLAFTDADCRPAPDWISRGVAALAAAGAPSFVGGHIEVEVEPGARTGAGLWDRLHGLRQDTYVLRDGYAATANLLVAREVFDRVGPFDAGLASGGDRDWGERAHALGVRPVFARDVVVHHPARASLAEAHRKMMRVHAGWAAAEAGRGLESFSWRRLAHALLPHSRSVLRSARRLGAEGYGPRDRARYVLTAHWMQYVALVAWLRAVRGVRSTVAGGRPRAGALS
jgi:glycosyltransferase involved in cell wall biosynthesis